MCTEVKTEESSERYLEMDCMNTSIDRNNCQSGRSAAFLSIGIFDTEIGPFCQDVKYRTFPSFYVEVQTCLFLANKNVTPVSPNSEFGV